MKSIKHKTLMIIFGLMISQLVILAINYGSAEIKQESCLITEEAKINPNQELEMNWWVGSPTEMLIVNEIVFLRYDALTNLIIRNVSNPEQPTAVKIPPSLYFKQTIAITSNNEFVFVTNLKWDEVYRSEISIIEPKVNASIATSILNTSAMIWDITCLNNRLYVACTNETVNIFEIHCYDITAPHSPIFLGKYIDERLINGYLPTEIEADGSFVYFGYNKTLTLINFTTPSSPVKISRFNNAKIECMKVANNHLFASATNTLLIYVFDDNHSLDEIIEYDIKTPESIFIEDETIYLIADTNLYILDISDLEGINEISKVRSDSFGMIVVDNNRAYIAEAQVSSTSESQPFFYIYDVSDPENVVKLYHDENLHTNSFLQNFIIIAITLIIVTPIAIALVVISVTLAVFKNYKKKKAEEGMINPKKQLSI